MNSTDPTEPDFVQDTVGEHGDFLGNGVPRSFFIGGRKINVEDVFEGPNGVWFALAELYRARQTEPSTTRSKQNFRYRRGIAF